MNKTFLHSSSFFFGDLLSLLESATLVKAEPSLLLFNLLLKNKK
ncbi:hypothetical protein SDE12394_08010 [Streptococcus dysgalactiae subsp. equisimilis ATCC 12394]|nr:hypothetical protein SDE12394_08010 [Streptococcus dysgalactiae subsp. equisimilis ATCC 12394]